MIGKIVLPHSFDVDYDADFLVGVDYGAYQLAKRGIKMDVAIGDFDSVSEQQLSKIKRHAEEVVVLPDEKNETDSEAALMYMKDKMEYTVSMIADFGVRFDHLLNNFHLLSKYDFTLIDQYNKVFRKDIGTHYIENEYDFMSLFTLDEALIDVDCVKYPLKDCRFTLSDTYLTSNEIVGKEAILTIKEGSVIVVLSKDK